MENLFIVPITPMRIGESNEFPVKEKAVGANGVSMFKDVFQNLVSQTVEAEENYAQQQYLLATGQIDDAHTVTIAGSYAQLSVDMLVSLRNKAVESYNELMRLSV